MTPSSSKTPHLSFFVKPPLKGCVRYIFASLFCMSKRERLRNNENTLYFTSKALLVREKSTFNILDIQMPKHGTRNTYY